MLLNRQSDRRGNVVVIVAFSLVAIFGVIALAIDGGLLLDNRRHVQATADAAALAAASDMFKNYTTYYGVDTKGTAESSALTFIQENGYTDENSKVTVNIPPKSGDHVGKYGYAEVILEYSQPSFFSRVFGHDAVTVKGRAVARGVWEKVNNGIIVLDYAEKASLNAHGNAVIKVQGADVIVNSNHSEAGTGSGGAILKAGTFAITGGVNDYAPFDGTVDTGVPPTPDPLRNVPPPNPDHLTLRSKNSFHKSGGYHVLYPGVYEGGISISGKAAVFLMPGIYYMDGGGFQFKGQGDLVGLDVMIYNAPQKSNDSLYIAGKGKVKLTGRTTGIYKGMVYFQDRNADVTGHVKGNGLYNILGTFYSAGGLMAVEGNGDVSVGAQYISRLLDIGGNGEVNITWRSSLTAPVRQFGLVE